MKSIIVSCVISAFVLSVAVRVDGRGRQAVPAPGAAAPAANAAEDTAMSDVCGVCHDTALVAGSYRLPSEWDQVIDLMVSYGAGGTDEQFALVRSYLLRNHGKANVNSATAIDLAPVLDVSLATAEAVVKYRDEQGAFATVDDLKKVPGIDPAKVDARKDRLVF